MNLRSLATPLCAGLLAVATMPAQAVTTTLTFDSPSTPGAAPACSGTDGGATDRVCSHNDFIGADYGSSSALAVSYDAGGPDGALRAYVGGFYDGGAYNLGDGDLFSNITFTPLAGFEVSLLSWSYAPGSATFVGYEFEVRDAGNNLVTSHSASTAGSFTANTAYYTGPLTLRFRSDSGGIVMDNIALDVRGLAVPEVPEPASWAMMIVGFGLIGMSLRRHSILMGREVTA